MSALKRKLNNVSLIQKSQIKVECSIDVLKDLAMCCKKGNEMQMLISKFEKCIMMTEWHHLNNKT